MTCVLDALSFDSLVKFIFFPIFCNLGLLGDDMKQKKKKKKKPCSVFGDVPVA